MSNSEETAAEAAMTKALNDLKEHWDCVQILACRETFADESKTIVDAYEGSGNYFARVGMAREFLIRDDEITRCDIRSKVEDADE